MAGRIKSFKPDDRIVQKQCENPDCEKTFYVNSIYASRTRFCSNNCLQHNFYLSRKANDSAEIEKQNKGDGNSNLISEDMESQNFDKILELTNELNGYKTQLALLERNAVDIEDLKNQVDAMRGVIHKKDVELRGFNEDLNRAIREAKLFKVENDNLRAEIMRLESEIEEEQDESMEINDDKNLAIENLESLITENEKLKIDKNELLWACIGYNAKGDINFENVKIPLKAVHKWLPAKDYPIDFPWEKKVWNWKFIHTAKSDFVIVNNAKKQ